MPGKLGSLPVQARPGQAYTPGPELYGLLKPLLPRPRVVSSLLNQRFLCILIRREELLASPYRGPSKPHKSGNQQSQSLTSWKTTVCWVREEDVFRHGYGTSLLMYMHSRLHFHSTSVLLLEYWLYKRGVWCYRPVTLSTGYVAWSIRTSCLANLTGYSHVSFFLLL